MRDVEIKAWSARNQSFGLLVSAIPFILTIPFEFVSFSYQEIWYNLIRPFFNRFLNILMNGIGELDCISLKRKSIRLGQAARKILTPSRRFPFSWQYFTKMTIKRQFYLKVTQPKERNNRVKIHIPGKFRNLLHNSRSVATPLHPSHLVHISKTFSINFNYKLLLLALAWHGMTYSTCVVKETQVRYTETI